MARITIPTIPHGSRGPSEGESESVLPWFVAIRDHHEQLEINEMGTWSELAAAHRDLVPGPRSPSGHPNRYATAPYRFPAAIPITGLGPISDALVAGSVGTIRWSSKI